MGKKDTVTKGYMSDHRRFADAFNYYVFDGKQIIQADALKVLDPSEMCLFIEGEKVDNIQKIRDLLKQCIIMTDDTASYVLLGLENQMNIHYAMPVRNILYDALNYHHQYSEQAKEHLKNKDLTGDEFLSGFSKEDKLKPVITLTIYWGAKKWDGPRSLRDMMEIKHEKLSDYINDYPLHLIVPAEIKDFSKLHTELKKALRYISLSNNKEAYKALSNDSEYQIIDRETANVLNVCVDTKITINDGEEQVNMCQAIEEIREEGRIEGELTGKIAAYLEFGLTLEDIAQRLNLSLEQVRKFLND